MILKAVAALGRLILGGLFLYAGARKAVNPSAFLADVESFRLLPYAAAVALSLYLPWLEIACGLGLWIGRVRRGALLLLWALLLCFLAALASAWLRGLEISCGCFGRVEHPASTAALILRDLGLLGLLALAGAGTGIRPPVLRSLPVFGKRGP